MTHDEFIKWLKEEIETAKRISENTALPTDLRIYQNGRKSALYDTIGRAYQLLPTPTSKL